MQWWLQGWREGSLGRTSNQQFLREVSDSSKPQEDWEEQRRLPGSEPQVRSSFKGSCTRQQDSTGLVPRVLSEP